MAEGERNPPQPPSTAADTGVLRHARSLPPALRGVRAAFVFLSRLPLGGFPYRAADWHWSAAHFPLVGAVVGAASALVFWITEALGVGRLLGATLALATSVWLTGAFHEDGLADSADGLGGAHGGTKRALQIMKDSRIGTYGAVAIVLSLMLRAFAIAELPRAAWFGIVLTHCMARVGPVWLMATQRYVSDPAAARSPGLFDTRGLHAAVAMGWGSLAGALGWALGGLPWRAVAWVALVMALVTALSGRYFKRAVGGITGDLLGAAEQLCEIAGWVTLLATLRY